MEIHRIALAGSDCSGKSSAEPFLREALKKLGYYVVFVPEGATRVILQYGLNPGEMRRLDPARYYQFQKLIVQTHLREEQLAIEHAQRFADCDKIVVIYDRGVMDAKAYMDTEDFHRLVHELGHTVMGVRDGLYDLVCHLVTAADGALEAYEKAVRNNPARRGRSAADAIQIDRLIKHAWLGHPHYRIIDNSSDFDGKMQRLLEVIKKELGVPERIEMERKFLVHAPPDISRVPVPRVPIGIFQSYILGEERMRARMCSQDGEGMLYYQTRKIPTASPISAVELEDRITAGEYWRLIRNRDPELEEICKTRHYFIHENQYFELDEFLYPERLKGLWILEIELTNETDPVILPGWLGPMTEVSTDKRYKNRVLARKPNTA